MAAAELEMQWLRNPPAHAWTCTRRTCTHPHRQDLGTPLCHRWGRHGPFTPLAPTATAVPAGSRCTPSAGQDPPQPPARRGSLGGSVRCWGAVLSSAELPLSATTTEPGGFRLCQAQPMTETARAWRAQGRALATALGGVSPPPPTWQPPWVGVRATRAARALRWLSRQEPQGSPRPPANEGTPGTAPPARALQPGTREVPSPSAVHTGGTAPLGPPSCGRAPGLPRPGPPAPLQTHRVCGGAAVLPRPREPGRLPR